MTPEEFNSKPFGDDQDIELLTVNWGMPDLTYKILCDNPSIKWVHSFSTGVDLLMTPELKSLSHRITLTNTKGLSDKMLGEFIAFAMLWFCKNAKQWLDNKAERKWAPGYLSMLSGLTLGIIGYGSAGAEVAQVAKLGFNMRVLGVKNNPARCSEKQLAMADEIFASDQQGLQKLLS